MVSDQQQVSPTGLHDAGNGVEARIANVGRQLSDCFNRVLRELPGRPTRPNELVEVLGVNRSISGRVLSATESSEPLSVVHTIPGPDPLRKLLRAARRKGVDAGLIGEAEQTVRELELLIRDVAGDRPALDAIISSLLPQARSKFELNAKYTVFRGTSLIKGAMAETWVHTAIVHPSATSEAHHDVAHLYGTLGLRRLRPNVGIKFTYQQFGTPMQPCRTLDGRPVEQSDGTDLDQFCTLQPATMSQEITGNGAVFALAGEAIGPQSAVDKIIGELRPQAMGRFAADAERNRKSLFVAPCVPVKALVFDVLLHESVYSGSEPALMIYDTTIEGMASVNDPVRDADRLDLRESIMVLGRDVRQFELEEMPHYIDMLRHAGATLGWDLAAFRGYRCTIQYPMHGSQVCMVFAAPPAPEH